MKAPFFIIGFQRSGTTLLRVMLDNHPDIAIPLDVTGLWVRYYLKLYKYNYLCTKDDIIKIIKDLLKDRPKTKEEIISEIKKQRFVKESTIILNLSLYFKKKDGKYTL